MKTKLLILSLLLLLVSAVQADESGCPAHKAAEQGFNPIDDFHKILAPVWHDAWPEKDYDALIAAGPKFKEAFDGIAKLEPKFKSKAREAKFMALRKEFKQKVDEFATAARAGDKEKVYEIMPDLHDAFEMTASSLLPVDYPEFDGFLTTLSIIAKKHIPKNNMEGIIGSTETLVEKASHLNEKTLPEELQEHKKAVLSDLSTIKAITKKMKECCDKKEMDEYKKHLTELQKKVDAFMESYI